MKKLFIILILLGVTVFGQFNTPTINGTVDAGEYGTHTNGNNQQANGGQTWFMTWDATNLYVAITGANVGQACIIYLDKDVLTPINSGDNSKGTIVGNSYDGVGFSELPFRADITIYVKNSYREYRTANGSGGWSSQTSGFGSYAEHAVNTVREFSIPWAAVGGQPSAFAWFGTISNNSNDAYADVPPAAGITYSTTNFNSRYYVVNSTANNVSIKPFSRDCYVFTGTSDINDFGSISVYDFTMNTSGRTIVRTPFGASWYIGGDLLINAGAIHSGSANPIDVTGNVQINSGATLELSQATLRGNLTQNGTFYANFWVVTFGGTSTQTLSGTGTFSFADLFVSNNSGGIVLAKDISDMHSMTVSGIMDCGTYTVSGGPFALESGATLKIGSPAGITSSGATGNIQTTTRNYDAGANYTYNGSSSQVTGNGLPTTLSETVTFSNTAGVTLSNSYATSGSFVVSGVLDCGTNVVSGAGSFTLNSGATLKTGSLTGVNGNITTTTKTLSTGTNYELNGAGAQITGTDLPSTVNKLILNNSNGLTLSQATTITTELGLTSGKLSLGANNLILGSSATISGTPSASNMVVSTSTGKLRKMYPGTGSFLFPVGDASNYTPVTLNFTAGTFDGSTYSDVNLTASAHPNRNVDNTNYLKRYWSISSNVTSPSCQVTLQYVDGDIMGSEAGYEIGRWTGTAWSNPTFSSRDNAANTITATTSGFSDFTGGEPGALPVELTSFNAAIRNGLVDLKWETKTEMNNYGFEVERKLVNSEWTKIGFVEGYGMSNSPKFYSFKDKPVGTGKISYRLKQIDNDGQYEYSPIVEVLVDNLPDGFILEQNYPNPFNPETSIRFALKEDTKATLKVYNSLGAEIATLFDGTAEAGRYYDVKFGGIELASGFYIYKLVAGEYVSVKKMLLMK